MKKIAQITVTFLATIESEEIGLEKFEENVKNLIELDVATMNSVANYLYVNDIEVEVL